MATRKKVRKVVKKAAAKKVTKKAATAKRGPKPGSKGIRYSAEKQAQILKDMADNGLTLKATAAKYNVSIPTLSNWKRKAKGGVPGRPGRPPGRVGRPRKTDAVANVVADIKVTDKATINRLLIQVGQGALREAGLGQFANSKDLAAFVAKLMLTR